MLADTVRAAALAFGPAVLADAPDGRLTYAELDQRSDAVAAAMRAAGVRPRDRVVLRLPSGVAYLCAYVGAAKLGAVTAGINSGLAGPEQDRLADLADPALVLDSTDAVTDLAARGATLPVPAPVDADPDEPAALVFTSGTTGQPRAAVFDNRRVAAVVHLDTGGVWAEQPGTPMVVSTHFAHVGVMTKLAWYLRRGVHLHVLPKWRADDVLRLIAEHRVAEVGAIAPQVALMLRSPLLDELDLSCVHRIIGAGAASAPALVLEARERFRADYVIRYSSTESGGCGLGTSPGDPDEALRSVGRPRPGIDAEVRDEAGAPLPGGEVGELWLRTPSAMTGYWRDEEATAETLVGGWLRTGDLACRNDDATFTLKGRGKEMYIRGGYNVYPAEVEAVLSQHPLVDDVVVVPRPDRTMGEVGVAVVTLRSPEASLSTADVQAFLGDRLARWKVPADVVVVAELPRNATDKLDRRAVVAMLDRTGLSR